MANIHFNQPKAPREEALRELLSYAESVCDLVHHAKFESDDGGNHLTLYLEVEDPSAPLNPFLSESFSLSTWKGHRLIILKVPPGYIAALIIEKKEYDY
jgi:hypothetical protein